MMQQPQGTVQLQMLNASLSCVRAELGANAVSVPLHVLGMSKLVKFFFQNNVGPKTRIER
jgi:hypothetical protein